MAKTWTFSKHEDGTFSWKSAVDANPLTTTENQRIFSTLDEAVANARSHGLVHDDLMKFSRSILGTNGE